MLLEACGEVEKCPEQGGAIIVGQFDEAGFLYQATEFDEMAGSGPAVLDPLALVVAGAVAIEAVTQHGQAL